jgi:hypothetical protein
MAPSTLVIEEVCWGLWTCASLPFASSLRMECPYAAQKVQSVGPGLQGLGQSVAVSAQVLLDLDQEVLVSARVTLGLFLGVLASARVVLGDRAAWVLDQWFGVDCQFLGGGDWGCGGDGGCSVMMVDGWVSGSGSS